MPKTYNVRFELHVPDHMSAWDVKCFLVDQIELYDDNKFEVKIMVVTLKDENP